jgi:hypothetical protein
VGSDDLIVAFRSAKGRRFYVSAPEITSVTEHQRILGGNRPARLRVRFEVSHQNSAVVI